MRLSINVEDALVDDIVRTELISVIDSYKTDLEAYKNGANFIAVFSTDKKKDIKLIKKQIKAYERVLKDYQIL